MRGIRIRAFTCHKGLYEFNKMPFGLMNAPATFQRLMDLVFAGLQGTECLVYLDDVIVYSRTFEEHLQRLRRVFQAVQKAGLKLQPHKCYFAKPSVLYLGHVVSRGGLEPDMGTFMLFVTPQCLVIRQQFEGS